MNSGRVPGMTGGWSALKYSTQFVASSTVIHSTGHGSPVRGSCAMLSRMVVISFPFCRLPLLQGSSPVEGCQPPICNFLLTRLVEPNFLLQLVHERIALRLHARVLVPVPCTRLARIVRRAHLPVAAVQALRVAPLLTENLKSLVQPRRNPGGTTAEERCLDILNFRAGEKFTPVRDRNPVMHLRE